MDRPLTISVCGESRANSTSQAGRGSQSVSAWSRPLLTVQRDDHSRCFMQVTTANDWTQIGQLEQHISPVYPWVVDRLLHSVTVGRWVHRWPPLPLRSVQRTGHRPAVAYHLYVTAGEEDVCRAMRHGVSIASCSRCCPSTPYCGELLSRLSEQFPCRASRVSVSTQRSNADCVRDRHDPTSSVGYDYSGRPHARRDG